jgi:hypothetical protein
MDLRRHPDEIAHLLEAAADLLRDRPEWAPVVGQSLRNMAADLAPRRVAAARLPEL